MTKRWLAALAVLTLMATGCKGSFEDAADGMNTWTTEAPGDPGEQVVGSGKGDGGVGSNSSAVNYLPSVKLIDTDGMSLVWSTSRNGAPAGMLENNTGVIDRPFEIRLEVTDTEIDRVTWYIDGVLFRDDDVTPPYNLRYFGLLPVDGTFDSDQGFDHSWTFRPGETHTVSAVARRGDVVGFVISEFLIADDGTPVPKPKPTTVPTTTAAPGNSTNTVTPPPTTTAPPTTTVAPATTTTAPPTTTAPVAADGRPIVMADADTVLNQPNTIYDFNFTSPGEVVIEASNVEARNIRGSGARRIGLRNGKSITDSGFRNFEFTFAHVQMSGGATVTRPYFIDGVDVNRQPNVGDGDIMQFFAYEGDIIAPLVDNVIVHGKQRPSGSDAHNDGIQYTGMSGGEVVDPTIRNSTVYGASSAGVQAKHVVGLFTFENNTLSEEFESYHAVIAKPGNSSSSILWRNNTLLDGASVAATGGWSVAAGSTGVGGNVTIN
ncbi:MAG: hypothetical protein RIB98_09570 [Acidimicrobiales bacterium]